MAGVINLSTDRRFDPSKWIAVGKIYKDVPEEVSDAYSAARQLPSALAATLPLPDLSVTEFLALKRPGILRVCDMNRITRTTEAWFSTDLPNCDPVTTSGKTLLTVVRRLDILR
ncbi:hypothetical protein B0H11DRAFT_1941370 [Mycena galericulata]|nr:hypothetical protein B0H11DRAFT_1941370 [Mycena galericulata]